MEKNIKGIVFSSNFETGNLKDIKLNDFYNEHLEVDLFFQKDPNKSSQCWFNFEIRGGKKDERITLNLFTKAFHVFAAGMRPVITFPNGESQILPEFQEDGKKTIETNKLFPYSFKEVHSFSIYLIFTGKQKYFRISFSFPYSFTDLLRYLNTKEQEIKVKEIVFNRKVIGKTLQGRKLEELTITSIGKKKSKKKTIFISSRIHPGEIQGSYILEGLINYLLNDSEVGAKLLRDQFVFKIIPMMNIDGVVEGYYRTNTIGLDLNREFMYPSEEKTPTVFACKELIKKLAKESTISMIVDLHGHINLQNCFFIAEENEKNLDFANEMYNNCEDFSLDNCIFIKNKKEDIGTHSNVLSRITGVKTCFTLETSYHTGKTHNINSKKDTKKEKNPQYSPSTFRGIGKSIGLSILSYFKKE